MNLMKLIALTALPLCAVALVCSPARAQHDEHDEHGQHDQEQATFSQPQTYGEAIHVIELHLDRIQDLIDSRDLDRVHAEAAVIRDIAKVMARLALKRDSGVPRGAIKEINLTAKDLAATFGPIDEAGDSGDRAGTQKIYDEMVTLFETLEKHVPKQYVCAMGCEPGKTYNHPQACPVCGMQLQLLTNKQYSVEISSNGGTIRAGQETTLTFQVKDPAGGPVEEFRVVHEKKLHLMMVSKDLSWYAHEHPKYLKDGTFTLQFSFPFAGDHVLFHDFSPDGVGMQVVPVSLHVEGTPPTATKLTEDHDLTRNLSDYTVRLDTHGALSAGKESVLAYEISRNGRPVTDLKPYLGAMGHVVIISEDLKQFVHGHPIGDDHDGESAHEKSHDSNKHSEHGDMGSGSQSSTVSFHAQFPAKGLYKVWAQFKHRGRVLTVPFVVQVDAAENRTQGGARGHDH